MDIYIDTEFTSLSDPRLISIGAVAAGGDAFYGVVENFPRRACTRFVIEQVLPVLEHRPANACGSFDAVARAFGDWLEVVSRHAARLRLVADDECDIEMLRQLLLRAGCSEEDIGSACMLAPLSVQRGAQDAFRYWFQCHADARLHNALDDARAYRYALMGMHREQNRVP